MALRTEYSLINSEFNDFLFAAVGEEKNGMPLTVLTALTRLEIDPWGEAARLAGLPREAAARALGAVIATLPEGDWAVSDSATIAARLLRFLPARSIGSPAPETTRIGSVANAWPAATWLLPIIVGVAVFMLIWHWQTPPAPAPSPSVVSSVPH